MRLSTIILLLPFLSFCQKNENIYNTINQIDENSWIVKYEFRDFIDSVVYDPKGNIGTITSFDLSGNKIEEEIYSNTKLTAPIEVSYSSKKVLSAFHEKNFYEGTKIMFQPEYLIERIKYHESNRIKEIQSYNYEKTLIEIVTINPETFEEKSEIHEGLANVKSGKWYFFDISGKLIKIEIYKNGNLIEEKKCR